MRAKTTDLVPAVVLSCHTIGLSVIRALGIMGVPVIAVTYNRADDMGHKSRFVNEIIDAPHPEKNEKEFIELLEQYANKHGKLFLIPADDPTLVVVSRHKVELEKYYTVQCTGWETTQRIIDKQYTYKLADEIGVPAPKTFVARGVDDVDKYASSLMFPCLVKPCYSHLYYEKFRKKMVQVNNIDEMVTEVRRAINVGIEVMLQELIVGDDTLGVNYNSFFLNGEPVIEFTSEKVRLSPPLFGIPCVVKSSDHNPQVLESGRKLLKALAFNGYSCTEFKLDPRDNKFKLLEVNGRHNRSGSLAVKSGMNFPWLVYNYFIYNKLSPDLTYERGVYWIDEFRDFYTTGKRIMKGNYSIARFVKPYLSSRVMATFDVCDIKPFLRRCRSILTVLNK